MINLACVVLFLVKIATSQHQQQDDSPCLDVLTYEPRSEHDRWFGVINLRTREELHGVWLRIHLDRKAELLGNWFGEATSNDNIEFSIKNPKYNLVPGPPVALRFFVKYDPSYPPPRVRTIRLNGRTMCGENENPIQNEFNTLHISKPATPIRGNEGNSNARPDKRENEDRNRQQQGGGDGGRPRPSSGERPEGGQNQSFRPSTTSSNSNVNRPSSENRPTRPRPSEQSNNRNTEAPITSNFVGSTGLSNNNNINTGNSLRPSSTTHRRPEASLTNINEEEFFPGDFNPSRRPVITTIVENANDNACGIIAQQPRPLITYGKETSAGQWPWHAALYRSKGTDLQYICGGSLISRKHVLTAAHCVTKLQTNKAISPELLQVYLGKFSLRKLNPGVQSMIVDRVLVHPEYNATVFHNDIAILKLTQKATVTDYVRPVCLWEDESSLNSVVERLGTVVGWGYDETGALTENLMQAQMPVVTTETCIFSNREFFSRFTSSKTYCAGFRNGTSACTGDSGGGMFFPKSDNDPKNKVWQIRGVVSLSAALQSERVVCDTSNYIIFTDVAKYMGWIKDVIERR